MLNKTLLITLSFSLVLASQEIDLSKISSEDIDLARDSLESSSTSSLEDIYTADSEDDSEVEETEIEIDDRNLIAGEKFGYGFITTLPPSITSVSDIPLPNDYKISIRDQFTIILSGSKEAIFAHYLGVLIGYYRCLVPRLFFHRLGHVHLNSYQILFEI